MRWACLVFGAVAVAGCGDVRNGAGDAESEAAAVGVEQFAAAPESYTGQEVTLERVRVSSRLGDQAFWIEFPNENSYLVKLDSALIAEGTRVASGEAYRVRGTVVAMSDSVLAAWQESGAIADPGQLAEAQYAMSFIEASRLQRSR